MVENFSSLNLSQAVLLMSWEWRKVFLKNYSAKVPLKRLAKSNEISNVIIFMSSDAATYITGSNIIVDGGWTII